MSYNFGIIAVLLVIVGLIVGVVIFISTELPLSVSYYLVDPTKTELVTLNGLKDSKFIKEVDFLEGAEIDFLYVDDTKYCIVRFVLKTKNYDGPESRKVMKENGIVYYRSKKEALESVSHNTINSILKECESKDGK